MKISQACIDLVKRFEGFCGTAYRCPAGKLTLGYGHTDGVKVGDTITQEQAERQLAHDLSLYAAAILRALDADEIEVTQGQLDALVSFAYNVGCTALLKSTLWRKLKDGDIQGAADEFGRWTKAGGIILPGLVKRRQAERNLFLS